MKFLVTAATLSLIFVSTGCQPEPAADTASEAEQTVTILGSLTGVGEEIMAAAVAPFTEATGIRVIYEGTDAFATVLPIRVAGGDKPDIALFPQPGLMADLVQDGAMVPLDSFIEPSALAYAPDWIELGSVSDRLYGIWMRADPKSLVWYNPQAFEAAGYEIPQTWDQLMQLSEQMVAEGNTPWCMGMESGDATGWVGTDWVENILLSSAGPAVYDQWVNHEIPFTAEPVRQAAETFGDIALNPDYVVGGPTGVISIPFGDSPAALFDDPPGCYLHRQASFIADFLPAGLEPGEDVSVFLLPSVNPEFEAPLLTGGIVFGMLNDTPAARQLMTYLATAVPHEIWAARGYITPHQGVSLSVYPSDLVRQEAEILANAQTIRFDGSDLMPAAVGTGTFWTGMVDYIGGEDLDTVLQTIEASWPE
ncbi:MAG: carbohydrate ABC transporter substrate-binding protein [Leptolyngbya sp. SIO4C1]|nr:carbohydrate ABC transporter substrate-binding protein [Leptolyngbya sp. SIO4C1]